MSLHPENKTSNVGSRKIPHEIMVKTAEYAIECMKKELITDLLKELGLAPEGSEIEDLKYVKRSFSYRIKNNSIRILSSWKGMSDYLNGKDIINLPKEEDVAGELVDVMGILGIEPEEKVEEVKEVEEETWTHPKSEKRSFRQRVLKKVRKKLIDAVVGNMISNVLGENVTMRL